MYDTVMKMIRNMVLVHLYGVMEENISENGKKENNMEEVLLLNQVVNKEMVNG